MSNMLFRLTCLTNLHMGSGDANYNVIDLEVERDPVLGEPTMNGSGVKGALRDFCRGRGDVEYVFGSEPSNGSGGTKQGNYNFLSGDLLARPVRVSEGEGSYLLATTPELLKTLLRKLHAFGLCKGFGEDVILDPPLNAALVALDNVTSVEGIGVKKGDCGRLAMLLDKLLGTNRWVLLSSQQLREIALPVLAHNVLEDGVSKNLWYEEVVPHESVFMLVIVGQKKDAKLRNMIPTGSVVQFGAGATTGNGFTLLERVEG